MAHTEIQPSPRENMLYPEDYAALVAAFEAQGHTVELSTQEEFRSGVPTSDEVIDIIIKIGGVGAGLTFAATVVGQVRSHLPSRDRKRKGVIYLDRGERHEFEISDDSNSS